MSKRKKSINVIAYLSVTNATDKNVDWKEEKQLSYISEYAKAHNLRIIKIMQKSIMGCSVVNTHFNKMVREIQNEKADGILVCNMAAISQNIEDAYQKIGKVIQAGGQIITVDEGKLNLQLKRREKV